MEILDLYDRDLKPTGLTIERGKPVPPGMVIPIVAVYVYNDKGQYLIQKVSPKKGNYYSTTAGHVQSGESDFALAMLREMKEEIGLTEFPYSGVGEALGGVKIIAVVTCLDDGEEQDKRHEREKHGRLRRPVLSVADQIDYKEDLQHP